MSPIVYFIFALPFYLLCLHHLEGFHAAGQKAAYPQEQFFFYLFRNCWVPPCIYGEVCPQFNQNSYIYCMFCLLHILWRILLSRLRQCLWSWLPLQQQKLWASKLMCKSQTFKDRNLSFFGATSQTERHSAAKLISHEVIAKAGQFQSALDMIVHSD